MRESSGRTTAKNPTSSAFGLWQGLYSTRVKYAQKVGVEPNTINPVDQIAMMRAYIEDRYGSAQHALSFHKRNNYY